MKKEKISINPELIPMLERYQEITGAETIEQTANLVLGFGINTLLFKGKITPKTDSNDGEISEKEAEKLLKEAEKAARKGGESLGEFMAKLSSKEEYRLKYKVRYLRKIAQDKDDETAKAEAKTLEAQRKIQVQREAGKAKELLDKECLNGMEAFNLHWIPLSKDVKQALAAYVPEWKKDAKRSDKRYVANGFRPQYRRLEEVEQRKKARAEMESHG